MLEGQQNMLEGQIILPFEHPQNRQKDSTIANKSA